MVVRNSDTEWEKFGRNDPYYGVLSLERFRRANLGDDAIRDFFDSGSEHIRNVLETIKSYLASDFLPARALDFGCGVGRCSLPLARVCSEVVGVDVSQSMLDEARKNATKESMCNLELALSDDELSRVSGTFDLIHSVLVFQHIPRQRGEKVFSRLVELLSENGVGAVQFVYYRRVGVATKVMGLLRKKVPLLHNMANLLYGKGLSEPLMEKNAYDLNRLLAILDQHKCSHVHLEFDSSDESSLRNVIVFFAKGGNRPRFVSL